MDTTTNSNLLIQIEKISHDAAKCNLDFTKIQDKESVNIIADFLSITFEQSVLFSCLVELSLQRMVTLEMLSRHLKCSVLKIISTLHEFEALEKKSLVKKRVKSVKKTPAYNDIAFTVPHNVVETLRVSDKTLLNPVVKLNLPNLLEQVKFLIKEHEENMATTQHIMDEVRELIMKNLHHVFIQYINNNIAKIENKCIALILAYYRLTGQTVIEIDELLNSIIDDITDNLELQRSIVSGSNELVTSGYILLERSEYVNDPVISLTKQSLSILYQEYPELIVHEIQSEGMIKANGIVEKVLYFNNDLESQINNLVKVLGKRQFSSFKKAAKQQKIITGVTAIFHGHSGTGKTEVVYQLARKTNRDIMMVDLSQTKSMWFGESEKQVQKIFEDYKKLLKVSTIEPILFINEADGFFSKRLSIDNSSKSSAQTTNTMQNIMLQALENFEGILIATTNLTENLDKAFERRFLFKIEFPKPDSYIRAQIWKSRLPELSSRMAAILGGYELSGGQIDNQIRQLVLKKVITKNLDVFETLNETCSKEKGFSVRKTVGF